MKTVVLFILVASLAILAWPATGALKDVPAQGTVFIGEQGLDITAGIGGNTQIAWFPSTALTTSATPEKVIDVTAIKTNFYVSPTEFSSRTGNWYSWAAGLTAGTAPVAFRVDDPYIVIKIRDTTAGVDVTNNQWLYLGDTAQFRIETNVYPMSGRGVPGAPITIKVQSPDGATYTSLYDAAGTARSLEIDVPSSPYDVPAVLWDSGNPQYKAGTYTIWAECTANSINNNYPVTGKTVSPKVNLLLSEFNPLIKGTTQTAITSVVTTRTTTPAITTEKTPQTPATTTPGTSVPTLLTQKETVTATEIPKPVPSPTRASGLGASLAVICCIAGIALSCIFRRR